MSGASKFFIVIIFLLLRFLFKMVTSKTFGGDPFEDHPDEDYDYMGDIPSRTFYPYGGTPFTEPPDDEFNLYEEIKYAEKPEDDIENERETIPDYIIDPYSDSPYDGSHDDDTKIISDDIPISFGDIDDQVDLEEFENVTDFSDFDDFEE